MHVFPNQPTPSKERSALFSFVCSLLLIGLIVGVWNMVSNDTPFLAAQTPRFAIVPSKITSRAFFKPTAVAKPATRLGKLGEQNTHEIPADQIVAEVNGVVISQQGLETFLTADQAMTQLRNTPSMSDHTPLLERLINNELIQQTAQLAGVELDPATVEQHLQAFLVTHQKSEADLRQALAQVKLTRAEFENYFARLLLVDTFVRAQAKKSGLSTTDYLWHVQQTAQISFGPAAALTFAVQSSSEQAKAASSSVSDSGQIAATTKSMPAFTVPILNATSGSTLTPNRLLGHPTVLSFWTTWCPYSRRQTPILAAAQAMYAKQGIQFIGINVHEQPDFVRAYLKANRIAYPVGLDSDGHVARAFDVTGFPITYFLDGQGQIVARQVGALTADKLAEHLQKLLNTVAE